MSLLDEDAAIVAANDKHRASLLISLLLMMLVFEDIVANFYFSDERQDEFGCIHCPFFVSFFVSVYYLSISFEGGSIHAVLFCCKSN